jgi:predicted nucleotidyltransferase
MTTAKKTTRRSAGTVQKLNVAHVLRTKLPRLKKLLAKDPRVLGVFLFGSQVEGTATPRSDLDLAVLFDRDLSLREELEVDVAISEVLDAFDVDLVNLNRANLAIQFRAIAGQIVYERDPVQISDFIERVLIETRDFAPRAEAALRDYMESL